VAPSAPDEAPDEPPDAHKTSDRRLAPHIFLLLLNILPIVILSKSLGKVIDYGIEATGAPHALGGIIIAMLVFTPEGLSALIAIRGDQLTRAINLSLGGVASTLGLTVPAVLAIGIYTGHTVVLGLPPASVVLLVATLILSVLTFTGWRTTMLEGAVHLSMFAVFLVLVFSP
jgi:Ca2+:H+ antiporter